jgi:predicted metalloenzyme YecM
MVPESVDIASSPGPAAAAVSTATEAPAPCATSNGVDAVLGDTATFIGRVVSGLRAEHGLDVSMFQLDHVCFRCVDNREYLQIRDRLREHGNVVIESMIGGRPISVFELTSPIVGHGFSVQCVELACPKPGRSHAAGLEHAEFVVGVHPKAFAEQHPSIRWNWKAAEKMVNPDVCVDVGGTLSAKFHQDSLFNVGSFEASSGATEPVPPDYFAPA